jgi:hypothetical protein
VPKVQSVLSFVSPRMTAASSLQQRFNLASSSRYGSIAPPARRPSRPRQPAIHLLSGAARPRRVVRCWATWAPLCGRGKPPVPAGGRRAGGAGPMRPMNGPRSGFFLAHQMERAYSHDGGTRKISHEDDLPRGSDRIPAAAILPLGCPTGIAVKRENDRPIQEGRGSCGRRCARAPGVSLSRRRHRWGDAEA